MPGEDGYSLMARLRASAEPRLAAVPAIALTAYVGSEVRRRALAAGFDVYLTKPIDPERLLEFVARLATRGRNP